MALTEQEEFELLSLEREKAMGQQTPQQPAQGQGQNILQQLLQSTQNTIGGIVGGIIEPPTKIIGRAGQAAESMLSGQPPQEYSIPLPQYMGGNIDIKPAQNVSQALTPVALTTLNLLGIKGMMNPKSVTKVFKYDNSLKQAQKAKTALDETRNILGNAKNIALQEVKDIPAELNWSGNVSQKVINAIKNPIYKIEFTNEGGVVNTIGNLDKIKSALQDLTTAKDFVEAGNMEKRQILQFAGRVRDTMLNAANSAGKPQLAKALKSYHDFMDNFNLVNDKLVDKYGNAMANKLKSTFKWNAEPVIKEAWKEISKISPEIKSVMKSMNSREILKNLLKITGVVAGAGLAGKGATSLLENR